MSHEDTMTITRESLEFVAGPGPYNRIPGSIVVDLLALFDHFGLDEFPARNRADALQTLQGRKAKEVDCPDCGTIIEGAEHLPLPPGQYYQINSLCPVCAARRNEARDAIQS